MYIYICTMRNMLTPSKGRRLTNSVTQWEKVHELDQMQPRLQHNSQPERQFNIQLENLQYQQKMNYKDQNLRTASLTHSSYLPNCFVFIFLTGSSSSF